MDDADLMFSERQSIRDSARPLKKYGSTSSNSVRSNEHMLRHVVEKCDTLQGIALKYGCTTEQIRRANRLFASDHIYLQQTLQVPVSKSSQFYALACNDDLLLLDDATMATTQATRGETRTTAAATTTIVGGNAHFYDSPESSINSNCNGGSGSTSGSSTSSSGSGASGSTKSPDSIRTLTPDEENRKSINDFLSKIDNVITESRKYVERSKEHAYATATDEIDAAAAGGRHVDYEWNNNQANNYNNYSNNNTQRYKQQQQQQQYEPINGRQRLSAAAAASPTPPSAFNVMQHQRQNSSGSGCSDTTHLLSTAHTTHTTHTTHTAHNRHLQNSIQRLEKEQDDFFEL